jgi:hypothetical protein
VNVETAARPRLSGKRDDGITLVIAGKRRHSLTTLQIFYADTHGPRSDVHL